MAPNSGQSSTCRTDRVKNLYLVPEGPETSCAEYGPYFYAEIRIDFGDVRTGFQNTVSLCKALDIHAHHADAYWVDDMIHEVDPRRIQGLPPDSAGQLRLPEFVDGAFIARMETQYMQYLLRSCEARIYRNFELSAYSGFGESRDDFIARCRDMLEVPMRRALDQLRDRFNRRLEQLKEKYVSSDVSRGMDMPQAESRNRDIYGHYAERIATLFLKGDPGDNVTAAMADAARSMPELEERVTGLEREARRAVIELRESFEEKSRLLDEYILHPNLKDIHFVRSGILWMPQRTA